METCADRVPAARLGGYGEGMNVCDPGHASRRTAARGIPLEGAILRRAAFACLVASCIFPTVGQAQEAPGSAGELVAGEVPVPAAPADVALPTVETIISDKEFNDAVPALDPADDAELDRPLETIEAFERRLAAEEAGAAPEAGQEPPLGVPALADGDIVEEVGDAPVRDAELLRPLPPIDQFEVEPVRFAEADGDTTADDIGYRFVVNGMEEVDEQSASRMRAMFADLSALDRGDGKAENIAMLNARLEEDREMAKRLLAAEGWYSPTITTRVDQPVEKGGKVVATIDIAPGKRFAFSDIHIEAPATVPPSLIADNLALKVGEPIVAQRVQGAEAQVALALPENGYPFAEVLRRSILLDADTGQGIYTLPVNPGVRARFGGIATEGNLAFDASHIDVLARFERGELYDSRKVDDLRRALVATGLFATVSAEPQPSGEKAPDGTEYVTMLVRQDAGPPRTIAGTAGYGAGQGAHVEATWTHRNMFRPEGALIVRGVAGSQEQGAGVIFRRSNAGKRDRTFELVAEAFHNDYDAYSAYTGRLAARMRRNSTPIWQKKITYAVGVELLATAEKDYDFARLARNRRTFYVGSLSGELGLDLTDDLLDPKKGFRITALVEPEGALNGGFNPYVRARVDGSAYYPVGDSLVLAGRVRVGTIQGVKRFSIPPSRRLYSGGGGSVRGFAYQALGPQDPEGDPIGGRSLNEAAAEVRYRFGNFGIVGFVDVGQSYESSTPQFNDLRWGAGIGGRFYTNFGPVRLDVATPLNRRKGESRFNLYVSIGQAF